MTIKPWGKYCIPLQKSTVSWRDTIEKRRYCSLGKITLIPDCSPSAQGLQSVYRRTRVRILKDWLKNAERYIQEYGMKRERAKSVKPVVQFHILVELEIVLYTCLMRASRTIFCSAGERSVSPLRRSKYALETHRTSLPPTRERQAGFVVCRIVCRTAIPDNTDICLRRGVFSNTPPS